MEEDEGKKEVNIVVGRENDEEDANGIIENRLDKEENTKKERNQACEASKYFLSMTRWEVFMWHLSGVLSAFRCACCKKPGNDKSNDYYQLIHHRYIFVFLLICVHHSEVRLL